MKLKLPNLPKLPKFRWPERRSKPAGRPRPPARYQAATRRAAPPALESYDEEDEQPTTKLSSAFFVVLILHVVFVGGIYAFNSIKAHRHNREAVASAEEKPVAAAPVEKSEPAATPRAGIVPASPRVYHAHGGETVAKLAAQHGVNAADLAEANGITQATVLKANQTLTIPQPRPAIARPPIATDAKRTEFLQRKEDSVFLKATPAVKPAAPAPATYKMAKGDTVYSVARKFSVSPEELLKANKIEDSKKVQIGQVLKMPAKKTE